MNKFSFVIIIVVFASCDKQPTNTISGKIGQDRIFERIDSDDSGIHFNNRITENLETKENLFDFDYFYNGAGVGIADINNDGLQDLFFCGNQVDNRLYLNKGNFTFEDISITANINENKHWSNGVTFADVNNDGWLDIYVSQGGPQAAGRRKNLLFINQKDLTFKEETGKHGLADDGLSTQSAFFDYDKDGDNDLYVVSGGNEFGPSSELYRDRLYLNDGKGNFLKSENRIPDNQKYSGKSVCALDYDRDGDLDLIIGNRVIPHNYPISVPSVIYRNDNGTFTEVTKEVAPALSSFGIVNKILKTDFNNDGWEDFICVGEWTHIGIFENVRGKFKDVSERSALTKDKGWWFTVGETDVNKDGKKDYIVGNVSHSRFGFGVIYF